MIGLDELRIATPCTAEWRSMEGDDRARLCRQCDKHVYNLSGMTRAEAEAVIVATGGKLCMRYFVRHDGTILLADCEVGLKHKQKQRLVAIGAAVLLASGGVIAYKLNRPTPPEQRGHVVEMAGEAPAPIEVMGGSAAEPPPVQGVKP